MSNVHSDASGFTPTKEVRPFLQPNEETTTPRSNVRVEATISKKFVERPYKVGSFEYERKGKDPGKIIIFNMDFANDPDNIRSGSHRDVNTVITCFQRLGFNIDEEDIHTDLTTDGVRKVVGKVSNMDLSEVNCLIVFFFTHGKSEETLTTTDGEITTNELIRVFSKSKSLAGKPKLFVIQACKGNKFTTTTNETNIKESTIISSKALNMNIPPDLILLYATVEGTLSYRELTGSWFIQELCRNMAAYGLRDDIASIAIRTTKCVCGNYFAPISNSSDEDIYRKQLPLMVSTLKRKFYLNTNKDRHILIKLMEDVESIKKTVINIEQKTKKHILKSKHDAAIH